MCDLVKRIVKANEDIKHIKTAQSIGESNARVRTVYKNNKAIDFEGVIYSKEYFILFETEANQFPLIQLEGNVYRNGVAVRAEISGQWGSPPFYWLSQDYRQGDYNLLKQWGCDINSGKYAFAILQIEGGSTSAHWTLDLTVKATHSGLVTIRSL